MTIEFVGRGSHTGLPKPSPSDKKRWLVPKDVLRIMHAAFYAEAIGMPLYIFATITWQHSSLFHGKDTEWHDLQQRLLDDLTGFCTARGAAFAYIWTRERKRGVGPHTHLLIHIGRGSGRTKRLAKLASKYLTQKYQFGPKGILFLRQLSPLRRFDRIQYICKGLDPHAFRYLGSERQSYVNALGLTRYPDHNQGIIKIPRCGVSRNLDRSARKENGWREMRDLEATRRALYDPYYALLQLEPPPSQTSDPSLTPLERLRAMYSDTGFQHRRRLRHYRLLYRADDDEVPRQLIPPREAITRTDSRSQPR